MQTKLTWIFILLLWAIVLAGSFYRDTIMINQDGFGDLRNRVVGARLIKDGKSPYWYKWQSKDSTRYYDRWNISPYKVSNITATPFFHHLLAPIADTDQKQLSHDWLIIEYLVYLLIIFAATMLPGIKTEQRFLLLIPALFFPLAVPWLAHVCVGQNYIFIPLLLIVFFLVFQRQQKNFVEGFCCGTIAIVAVLIRPTLVLFFIPFLFYFIAINKRFITGAAIPLFILLVWFAADKKEQLYWIDYKDSISEQIKYHQDVSMIPAEIEQPKYTEVEGVSIKKSEEFRNVMKERGIFLQFQSASIYKLVSQIFHKTIPLVWLNIIAVCFCILVIIVYSIRQQQQLQPDIVRDALAGFCLYFISDILSPIDRGEYGAVVWLFPMLLLASVYKPALKYSYLLFLFGFILNIFYFKINKIQYAIGEYIMFGALLYLVFWGLLQSAEKKENVV